jgi:collagen triple helix repeat protein
MRRRLSYANVTATLALFFAMSGGALAAKHYLLSSTRQISPKVMKALKGNVGKVGNEGREGHEGKEGKPGKDGPEGHEGKQGTEGHEGKVGPAGPYPTVLPSGVTETGDWGGGYTASGVAEYRTVASFPIPLPATLEPSHVIYVASTAASHCSGVGQAERGYLCVYQKLTENAETPENSNIFNPDEGGKIAGAGVHGFEITLKSKAAGLTTVSGTFAVTAP